MDDSFKIIGITLPEPVDGEAGLIELMLREGIGRMHIRKPDATGAEMEQLIEAIHPDLRPRLSLHSHHHLAVKFGTGIHLNAAHPTPPEGYQGILSRSCHSLKELEKWQPLTSYCFISPVFDSISKTGYTSAFTPQQIASSHNISEKTIALGGVTPDRFKVLRQLRFGGAAMLGYLWADRSETTIIQRIHAAIHHSYQHPLPV